MPLWQLPRICIEDTVLDLVDTARTFDDAFGWLSRAIGRRLTTGELLGLALASRSRIRWRGWLTEALADVGDGAHSPLERRYMRGVERAHGLPAAVRQADSKRRDFRRDNAGALAGDITLRYETPDVTERRCQTAIEVGAVLRGRGWAGTPSPCGQRCPVLSSPA